MRNYSLTRNLSLVVRPCQPIFKFFIGKTNRLALVSMSLCGVALDLYITRQWSYPAWEQESEFLSERDVVPMYRTRQSENVYFLRG